MQARALVCRALPPPSSGGAAPELHLCEAERSHLEAGGGLAGEAQPPGGKKRPSLFGCPTSGWSRAPQDVELQPCQRLTRRAAGAGRFQFSGEPACSAFPSQKVAGRAAAGGSPRRFGLGPASLPCLGFRPGPCPVPRCSSRRAPARSGRVASAGPPVPAQTKAARSVLLPGSPVACSPQADPASSCPHALSSPFPAGTLRSWLGPARRPRPRPVGQPLSQHLR